MANRYWVGGTANWDIVAGTKWATTSGGAGGASVPTNADDVFFDANSTGTCTITSGLTSAKSIDCTGFTGGLNSTVINYAVYGSVILNSTMTSTGLSFIIAGTGTVTTAGKTLDSLTISATGGTVTLGSALTVASGGALAITAGTFTTSASNYSITTPSLESSGTSTRAINLNGSTVTLSGGGTTTSSAALYFESTNLTVNAGTSTITLSSSSATFYGGGKAFNIVNFTSTTAATVSSPTAIWDTNTFAQLSITAPSSTGVKNVKIGDNQTITTFVCAGATAIRRLCLFSDTPGTRRTLTVTTWSTISDVDFRDIGMNSSRSGTRLGNCGGNLNITFSAAKTVYFVGTGSANWGSAQWATSSGGATDVNNFPLAQDNAVIDNSSLNSAATLTINGNFNVGNLSFASRSNAITFATGSQQVRCYSSLTMSSAVTVTGTSFIEFAQRGGTQDITSTGVSFTQYFRFNNVGGTIRPLDALSAGVANANSSTIANGTLNLNGQTVTLGKFNVEDGSTRNITFNGGTLALAGSGTAFQTQFPSGFTTTAGTGTGFISFTSASAKTFSGSSVVFNCVINQGGAGALTLTTSGCTFQDLQNSYAATGATSILFFRLFTQTFTNFTASGAPGNTLTLSSDLAGTQATLSKSSGTVSVSNCSIQDLDATGGATWQALTSNNNIDAGNNSGWIFSAGGGNFIAFFM